MKALNKYLKNREAAINFLLSKPRRKFTPGTFHKLRVEIKKLNAFLDLVNFCAKDFKRKKTFKAFKHIFRLAGKVRELQLEEAMIKNCKIGNSLIDYRKSLRKIRLKEQDDFFAMVDENLAVRLKKRYPKIVSFLNTVDNKEANSYMKKRGNRIKKLVSRTSLQTYQLHELRKLLKTYNYCARILSLENRSKPVTNYDVLPKLLGNWRDCRVVVKKINERIETCGVNPEEIGQLDIVKKKIISYSEILFRKIKTALTTSKF